MTLPELLEKNGGKLPSPFKKLIEATGGSSEDVVLIPKGRSLVKDKVSFEDPRILLSPKTNEVPAPLIIGYSPSTDSLEITSWNPLTKKYDFVEVENYSKVSQQKIKQDHSGKCISCHTNSGLLFTPAPWGELLDFGDSFDANGKVRERRIPSKIFETAKENGQLEKWKKEYGIDLEKYKADSSKQVVDFFNKVSTSSLKMNGNQVCEALCQGENQIECRKIILKSFLQTSAFPSNQPNFAISPEHMALVKSEVERLKGKSFDVVDFLIPDFNPETGIFYESARTEGERRELGERVARLRDEFDKTYMKDNPPPEMVGRDVDINDPAAIAFNDYMKKKDDAFMAQTIDGDSMFVVISKFKVSPEEAKVRYGTKGFEDRLSQKQIEFNDVISAIRTGSCFGLSKDQLEELRENFSAQEVGAYLEDGSLDSLLSGKWPLADESLLVDKIFSLKEKESVALSTVEKFCLNPLTNYMPEVDELQDSKDDIQLLLLRQIFAEKNEKERIKKAFNFYCMECHGVDKDEAPLDLDNLDKLKDHEDGEVYSRISKNRMPPKSSSVRKKYGTPADPNETMLTEEDIKKVEALKAEMIRAMKE
jgi:hypothetical protein